VSERRTSFLRDIRVPLVRNLSFWRTERIKTRRHSRGAAGAVLDVAIRHRIFAFAVKTELIQKNPVQMEGRPGDNPASGAGLEEVAAMETQTAQVEPKKTKLGTEAERPGITNGSASFAIASPSDLQSASHRRHR